ncbi:hypothetical protein P255_02790 [Acinetobacter brisouii CIP 110357]|uniref:Uncharacterized protein n=1 Tax=Acinetobacter brisouii CIP 110357 TaxID=1341683 RepID=V2UKC8_9GAMM|nr:hypothetical protein [Acinetobacter brisouii]ENV48858.1 hypothetical protein F954_00076 [Acinetobacter brisouii ANC 4119]ESK49051.1 hypothetical protein P255_02790 [Acinetobacter brisouii CIP 110357]
MSTKAQLEITYKLSVLLTLNKIAMLHLMADILVFKKILLSLEKNDQSKGEIGLANSKPYQAQPKLRMSVEIEDKIIHLRQHTIQIDNDPDLMQP